MPIDWIFGLIGGVFIGTGAAVYLLVNGRILGASGIIGGLVDGSTRGSKAVERLFLLAGLILAPALLALTSGGAETHLTSNMWIVVLAGLAVGVGTRLANGCTSGHGVCGISRMTPRGLASTALYIGGGMATVALIRTLAGGSGA